jgi:precorrin-4 methylase
LRLPGDGEIPVTDGTVQVMSAAAALRTEFTIPELCAYVTVHPERVRVIVLSRPDLFERTLRKDGNAFIWRVTDLEKLLAELGDADGESGDLG